MLASQIIRRAKTMSFRKWSLIGLTCAFLVAVVLGQVTAQQKEGQKTPPPSINQDQFDKAHEGIFANQPDKAKEASRLTAEAAKNLPKGAMAAVIPHKNFIDDHIFGRIEKDHIPHAPLATDEEFVRRAYLDAIGLLPTPDKVRRFVADNDPQKRDKLIDSLIGTMNSPTSGHGSGAICSAHGNRSFNISLASG